MKDLDDLIYGRKRPTIETEATLSREDVETLRLLLEDDVIGRMDISEAKKLLTIAKYPPAVVEEFLKARTR